MKENLCKFRFIIMLFKCHLFILYGIWIVVSCASVAAEDSQRRVFPTVIWSDLGGDAVLPCDVSVPADDKINMILWFKDNAGIPIYSYDARGVDSSRGVHMTISDLERRCLFKLSHDTGGTLKLFNITEKDRGLYKCRVDFLNSPTQQHKLALDLIELPSSLTIMESGNELTLNAGPYLEDDELHLTCIAEGGKPAPKITWRINDDELHGSVKESESRVISSLTIRKIPRHFYQKMLTCEANIPGLAKPHKKSVQLDIQVKPLAVLMLNGNNVLKDGESFSFLCECFGSNPPASISWLLDGEPIRSSAITAMHTKNKTTSKMTIRADSTFNDKELFCRCENEKFPEYYLEDKKILQVHYRPITNITLHSAYNSFHKVREGDNVSLECIVNGNPPVTSITWYQNGRILEKETNHTMYYLRNISLHAQGEYSCEATNKEGRSKSQSLMVNVLHVPSVKKGNENQHIMAAVQETVILQCEIEPGLMNQHVQFFWTINNTVKVSNVLDDDIQSSGKISILKYTPLSESDFGTLGMLGRKRHWAAEKPCYIHLTLANKPERPRNCVANNTNEFLQISCEPGFDGGLKQYFVLEIRTANYTAVREDTTDQIFDQLSDEAIPIQNKIGKPLYKLQKENPVFDIFSLENGLPYVLTLYAVNLKGRSEAVVLLQGLKASKPSNSAGVSSESAAVQDIISLPSIYITLISSALLLVCLTIITAIIVACRNRTTVVRRRENVNNELNNFRIVYSDVERSKRGSNYEPEF